MEVQPQSLQAFGPSGGEALEGLRAAGQLRLQALPLLARPGPNVEPRGAGTHGGQGRGSIFFWGGAPGFKGGKKKKNKKTRL